VKRIGAWLAVGLAGVAHTSCNPALLLAPPGATLKLLANPPSIAAHGGVSEITALIMESTGVPAADGTVVQFFTDLGRVQEQGRTNDGVARIKLVSDSRSGTAQVTAISGATSDKVSVAIGSVRPRRIIVNAVPSRIVDSRSAHIIATVLDDAGNPIPNIPVFFFVGSSTGGSPTPTPAPASTPTPTPAPTATPSGPTPTPGGPTPSPTPSSPTPTPGPSGPLPPPTAGERMDSSGNPVFTDNNGRAEDVLHTSAAFDATPFIVTIVARVVADNQVIEGRVDVVIN
jgi:hypothetical protein